MRKIASNLLLKEHAERVFFLCKQPDGYRIIKEIDGDYGQIGRASCRERV